MKKTIYKPILFSTPMVQAILEGRKTMTRRVIKPLPTKQWALEQWAKHRAEKTKVGVSSKDLTDADIEIEDLLEGNPIKKGVILWVRETFEGLVTGGNSNFNLYSYKADNTKPVDCWKPSLFMPKEAARIFLKVTDVYIDRLQNISEEDCLKEGISGKNPKTNFRNLWESLKGEGSWEENPYVWVYEFEIIAKPKDWCIEIQK